MMRLEVGPADAGQRLDALLAGPLGSRSRAQRLIEDGAVRVDGAPAKKRHLVAAGQVVDVDEREETVPEDVGARVDFDVPYEDEHLLVVDKPAGLVVHPARGHRSGTLAQALGTRVHPAAGGEEDWRAGIVHRLD